MGINCRRGRKSAASMWRSRLVSPKKKTNALLVLLLTMALTSGCGSETEESRAELQKDGSVKSVISESFDKPDYDINELQQMVLEESASYNRSVGDSAVSVEKVSEKDGTASVKMTYRSAADYAAFNDGIFFVGSPKEAEEEGYNLNKVLSSTRNPLETVGEADILDMDGDVRILITDMKDPVVLDGKAIYTSDNVQTDKKYKTVTLKEESGEPAYIIYK